MSNESSNSESTPDRPVAKVYPSKKSYKSIAADVDVPSALAELIDNSRDSAAIHDIDPVDVKIYFDDEAGDLAGGDDRSLVAFEGVEERPNVDRRVVGFVGCGGLVGH